eukprot:gnl/TRDRNA2_/TRDRNA2_163426_c0_seq2.p1 gnl/TRDRNA2_/TRDRNA2_163426_c0~~gnl/TRDRNA2_/TRDRNA2_163426_c0_seq2.p1  ORF type:complete len:176 (+),score=4.93 gnl/TRDRNA2_/TRDRNA2_163426_c0_seq2:148-675(+)
MAGYCASVAWWPWRLARVSCCSCGRACDFESMTMNQEEQWLLPDGVEEVLPERARAIEHLRRRALDLYQSWGYELVFPPLIEFLESLLNGAGRDLERETFKITDQLSGRLMGVRADMTPQVARMDAHSLRHGAPTRLCYCSTALRARPAQAGGSRVPYQTKKKEIQKNRTPHKPL